MERVNVTIYTDPGCPFGFNAQRQEAQLVWHYGHGLDITRRMIVLMENSASFEDIGLSREMVAGNAKRLRSTYGMPMRLPSSPISARPGATMGCRSPRKKSTSCARRRCTEGGTTH